MGRVATRVINALCSHCNAPFYANQRRIERTKGPMYCSRTCQSAAAAARPGKPHNRSCERCGTTFYRKEADIRRGFARFCSKVCSSLSTVPKGADSVRYKGGVKNNGYWMVPAKDHPNATKQGYIAEHRLVMEQHLGRYLRQDEEVHHINHVRDDNRLENLRLLTRNEHRLLHGDETRKGDTVACAWCGKAFYQPFHSQQRFCSRRCGAYGRNNTPPLMPK